MATYLIKFFEMKFEHLPPMKVTGKESEEYGDFVRLSASLLGKSYPQMHVLFKREKWTLEEIKTAYQNATKHNGNVTPPVAWWANRKKRNGT